MNHHRLSLVVLTLLFAAAADASELAGKVVHIADGDTVTVLDADNVQHKIRLWGIDAPESHQAFGQRAKQSLGDKVFGQQVTVEIKDKDRYGRLVGIIRRDGRNINLEQVADGFAWWYEHYAKHADELRQAEQSARTAKRGLWADPHAMPPWDYRKQEREAKTRK